MERGSDSAAAAPPRMQERRGGRSRARELLQLVHSGRLALGWPDARNHAASGSHDEWRDPGSNRGHCDSFMRCDSRSRLRQTVSPSAACGRTVRVVSILQEARPTPTPASARPSAASWNGRSTACRRSRPTNSPGWSSWPRRRRRRGRRRGVRAHAVRPTTASQPTTRCCPPSGWWPGRARSGTPRAPRSRCPRSPPGRGCSTTAARSSCVANRASASPRCWITSRSARQAVG